MIESPVDIERLVLKYGFLPFFRCGIENFSVEENTPDELWFSDEREGPWDWKGPVIVMGSVAYGKFFGRKAGFVSLDWLPDLMNYRRETYPIASPEEQAVYDTIVENESLISNELKRLCGYVRQPAERMSPLERAYMKANRVKQPNSKSRFESMINHLQMSTRVVVADFEYNYSKSGERYGWGKARYTTPELMYDDLTLPNCAPEESFYRIAIHLRRLFPDATRSTIVSLLR